jgi:hypothetical protein
MRGFRKVNGANWLNEVHYHYMVDSHGNPVITPLGKLPLHWNKVRNILINNQ